MKERPLLFSGPMVRALLNGSKTETRRVFKSKNGGVQPRANDLPGMRQILRNCPYGQPGDRLWVRENGWERPERTAKMMREGADTWKPYYFDADGLSWQDSADFKAWGFKRRPSIHMPRWASRITLEITEVRVERLQDISEADAIAEGIESEPGTAHWKNYDPSPGGWRYWESPIQSYRTFWNSINGPDAWDENPWVWVVAFKRVEAGEA
jgi:hypothetical protein